MTDHIPDAGKKVSTPKNLDGMVVDAGELVRRMEQEARGCDRVGLPINAGAWRECADLVRSLARPERASTSGTCTRCGSRPSNNMCWVCNVQEICEALEDSPDAEPQP